MTSKKIYFVRHGETNSNLQRYVPSKDEPLNEHGLLQAEQCATRVQNIDIQKLIVSDFHRAQQTAAPIAHVKNMQMEVCPSFGEVLEPSSIYGISESEESVVEHRKNRNGNVENPEWRQEDGENFSDIFARVLASKKLLEEDSFESILVVSHSFFMMLFAAAILLGNEVPTNAWYHVASTLKISNTGITQFTFEEGVWRLVMWNDHAHFAE